MTADHEWKPGDRALLPVTFESDSSIGTADTKMRLYMSSKMRASLIPGDEVVDALRDEIERLRGLLPVAVADLPEDTLAQRLTKSRRSAGYSVSSLARLVGSSPQTGYRWEAGLTEPHPSHLVKWAEATTYDPLWLLVGDPDE